MVWLSNDIHLSRVCGGFSCVSLKQLFVLNNSLEEFQFGSNGVPQEVELVLEQIVLDEVLRQFCRPEISIQLLLKW